MAAAPAIPPSAKTTATSLHLSDQKASLRSGLLQPEVGSYGYDQVGRLYFCAAECREQCPVHARGTRYEASPQERAARAKEALAERIERQTRIRILNAIRKKCSGTLPRLDFEMAALDYFERLGHDNYRRLCRVYGWEEKKTRASWSRLQGYRGKSDA
jgi:hypothetical protein